MAVGDHSVTDIEGRWYFLQRSFEFSSEGLVERSIFDYAFGSGGAFSVAAVVVRLALPQWWFFAEVIVRVILDCRNDDLGVAVVVLAQFGGSPRVGG